MGYEGDVGGKSWSRFWFWEALQLPLVYRGGERETQSVGEQDRAPYSWRHRSGTFMGFAAGAWPLFSPMLWLTRLVLVGPAAPGFQSQLLCHYL